MMKGRREMGRKDGGNEQVKEEEGKTVIKQRETDGGKGSYLK